MKLKLGSYLICAFRRACCKSLFGLLVVVASINANQLYAAEYTDLAMSRFSVCAINLDGVLHCRRTEHSARYPAPSDDARYVDVTLGGTHGCAITTTGTARCWGDNSFGQLDVPPTPVSLTSIEASENHTCAIDQNSSVICWGLNSNEQTDVPAPNTDFNKLVLGTTGSCGIKFDNTVVCWSTDGTYNAPGFLNVRDIDPVEQCALMASGNVGTRVCWGNQVLQNSVAPFPTGEFRRYVDLESGYGYFCARTSAGEIYCNDDAADYRVNENGDVFMSRVRQMPPVSSFGIFSNSVKSVAADGGYTLETALCGLTLNGAVSCVGTQQGSFDLLVEPDAAVVVDAPFNVRTTKYSNTSLELFWDYDREKLLNAAIAGFNIYRNGDLLTYTTNNKSYYDSTLERGEAISL